MTCIWTIVQQDHTHNGLVIVRDNHQRVLQNFQSSFLSHTTAAATSADKHWHSHRYECRKTLIYAHKISLTLQTCDISLGSLISPAPEV